MDSRFRVDTATVRDGLRRLMNSLPRSAAIALNELADETMMRSMELTPVRYGDLRRRAKVSKRATQTQLKAELTYASEYAVYVHEIPAPPAKSSGGRSARHRVGQWKFLETAVNETGRNLPARLAAKLAAISGMR